MSGRVFALPISARQLLLTGSRTSACKTVEGSPRQARVGPISFRVFTCVVCRSCFDWLAGRLPFLLGWKDEWVVL